ncbi:hypothetical protein BDB01DRAFT_769613 [Pilobolus umbonatus]|nr:hypothetical protein BDB01DRAFT_769613 [Pilobolus umbonatus]
MDSMHNIETGYDTGYTKQFWIGIAVSIATNIIQSFAMAFQRKSHILNDSLSIEDRKSSFKRPLWVTSFTVFLIANITGSIFSIGYLPIVILAPIGAIGLAFNAVAAKLVLNDPFSRKTVIGTFFIVVGALFVGLFGVIREPDHDINDLIRLYRKPAFIAYFSIIEFLIVAGILVTHYFEYVYCLMLSTDYSAGKIGHYSIELDTLKMYIGIGYGIIAGNISSQSILFAKTGLELVLLSIFTDKNQLNYALTWIILSIMVITAILQLYYLNKGLRLCDTVILVPLSSCTFNVSCLFNGLIYYDQWDRMQWWRLLFVMMGVVITVSGVVIVSWHSQSDYTLREEEIPIISDSQEVETRYSSTTSNTIRPIPSEKTGLLKKHINSYH